MLRQLKWNFLKSHMNKQFRKLQIGLSFTFSLLTQRENLFNFEQKMIKTCEPLQE